MRPRQKNLNISGIKQPRSFTYHGKTYVSIYSFCQEMQEKGYKHATLGKIRVALDLGRDLDEVLNGRKFPRRSTKRFVYKGVEYPSAREFYRITYKRRKHVYLTRDGFVACVQRLGVEVAVDHLLHKRLNQKSASKRLGGCSNLVHLRMKHGWSYRRAISQPKRVYKKKEGGNPSTDATCM